MLTRSSLFLFAERRIRSFCRASIFGKRRFIEVVYAELTKCLQLASSVGVFFETLWKV